MKFSSEEYHLVPHDDGNEDKQADLRLELMLESPTKKAQILKLLSCCDGMDDRPYVFLLDEGTSILNDSDLEQCEQALKSALLDRRIFLVNVY